MSGRLRITGGRVYDPRNGVEGRIRDVCVEGGRIVESLPPDAPTLHAQGRVVMPGGVDIHSHIAGSKVNLARRLLPELARLDPHPASRVVADGEPARLRSGSGGVVPSTLATGYRYAGLGYTTAFEAAVPALGARHVHHELDDTPVIDKGFYLLLGNDDFLLRLLADRAVEWVPHYVAWMLQATRAYAVKVVNPGGIAAWKDGDPLAGFDEPLRQGITPRRIVEAICDAVEQLRLPHPMHIHCNNLGVPGNFLTTLETMRAVEGRRAHFTHLQFHSYGGGPDGKPTSRARELIEYLNEHEELSADVGQVMFGPAVVMTADARVAHLLHQLTGRKWVNLDIELETGCGIVPFEYRDTNYVHTVQWATGMELFLLARDPWRMVLSTDHPNGGSFLTYPRLIRLLMDRTFRDEQIRRAHPEAIAGTVLADGLDREYTLYEIAIITRAGPARLLGLDHKGHLGPGADADITVYDPDDDVERMFTTPRWVFKGGVRVIDEGEIRREVFGSTYHVQPEHDPDVQPLLARFLQEHGTLGPDHYRIDAGEVHALQTVVPGAGGGQRARSRRW